MRTMLSGSSSSGGVGVGVGLRRGGGGGSPNVGAIRSTPAGRVVCGVCVGAGCAGVGEGEGVCVGGWALRGRTWPRPDTPNINPRTIRQQIASTPFRLRFCSLNNTQLTPLKPQNNSSGLRDYSKRSTNRTIGTGASLPTTNAQGWGQQTHTPAKDARKLSLRC